MKYVWVYFITRIKLASDDAINYYSLTNLAGDVMLKGFAIVVFAVIICGIPQTTKAGPEGKTAKCGVSYTDNGPEGKVSTNTVSTTVELRCRQTWNMSGTNNGYWVPVPPNGGGGDNEQCRLSGSDCVNYSWRTTHPVGWTPADDGKSTQEWIACGIQLIKDGALESGVVLTDADMEGLEYEESWIPAGG